MVRNRFVIKHLSGALRGKEQSFPDSCERIKFGRWHECDVIFPPEETAVARWHFELIRKPPWEWRIDIFGRNYVEVNGAEAWPGQTVSPDPRIRLGTEKGPSIEVIDRAWEPAIYEEVRRSSSPVVEVLSTLASGAAKGVAYAKETIADCFRRKR